MQASDQVKPQRPVEPTLSPFDPHSSSNEAPIMPVYDSFSLALSMNILTIDCTTSEPYCMPSPRSLVVAYAFPRQAAVNFDGRSLSREGLYLFISPSPFGSGATAICTFTGSASSVRSTLKVIFTCYCNHKDKVAV